MVASICLNSISSVKFICPDLSGFCLANKWVKYECFKYVERHHWIFNWNHSFFSCIGSCSWSCFQFGVPFVGGVLDNLLNLVNTLGGEGLVGLIVLAVLLDLYR